MDERALEYSTVVPRGHGGGYREWLGGRLEEDWRKTRGRLEEDKRKTRGRPEQD
jgi:hypothetical protein